MSDDESPNSGHMQYKHMIGTTANHYQPMMMSPPEMDIATQQDYYSSQSGLINSAEEEMLLGNPNVKPILPWAKLISKCNNMMNYELMDQPPDSEDRYNLYVLGRSTTCAIKFDTPRISNRHCMIYCKMNRTNPDPKHHYLEAFIEDTSANGTFVNKKIKLKKNTPRQLHSGDEICLLNPALLTQPNIGITEEDILKNTYHIMLNLPHQNKASNLIHANKSLKSQILANSLETTFGRSNTVIRLLKQQRNIYDFYEFRELLGTGTSGEVFHGIKKDTGKDWAIKVINLKKMISQSASNNNHQLMNEVIANTAAITKEAEMLRSLRHPHIIHLEDIFSDDENIFLIMELSYGGDLFDRISSKKFYKESEAKVVMWQLLDAMAYLHQLNIMHRDLKPENILLVDRLNDCNIKISDFGLAKVLEIDNLNGQHLNRHQTKGGKLTGAKTFCGTPQYFAPEVLQRQRTVLGQGSYSIEADMWSVGVIMYVLLAGAFPFSDKAMMQPQLYHRYNMKSGIWTTISEVAKDLVSKLLVVDPKLRLTARQAKEHDWFKEIRDSIPDDGTSSTPATAGRGNGTTPPVNGEDGKNDMESLYGTVVEMSEESMPPPPVPPHPPVAAVAEGPAKRTRSTRATKKDSTSMQLDPVTSTTTTTAPVSAEMEKMHLEDNHNHHNSHSNEGEKTPLKGRKKRSITEVTPVPVRASPRRRGNPEK